MCHRRLVSATLPVQLCCTFMLMGSSILMVSAISISRWLCPSLLNENSTEGEVFGGHNLFTCPVQGTNKHMLNGTRAFLVLGTITLLLACGLEFLQLAEKFRREKIIVLLTLAFASVSFIFLSIGVGVYASFLANAEQISFHLVIIGMVLSLEAALLYMVQLRSMLSVQADEDSPYIMDDKSSPPLSIAENTKLQLTDHRSYTSMQKDNWNSRNSPSPIPSQRYKSGEKPQEWLKTRSMHDISIETDSLTRRKRPRSLSEAPSYQGNNPFDTITPKIDNVEYSGINPFD